MPRRHKKGTVAVHNRNGMLRLRWSYRGRGYSYAMGLPDNPINRAAAEGRAAQIQKDIAFDEFDLTLDKYRPKPPPATAATCDLFEQFMSWRASAGGIAQQTINTRYKPLLGHLQRIGSNIRNRKQAERLINKMKETRGATSINEALCTYKAFGRWGVEQGFMVINPFEDLKAVQVPRKDPTKRRPFTPDEIKRLLLVISSDECLAHYYDFCLFLFSLGVRPSEAIGLRWAAVDLEAEEVVIREALVRSDGHGGRLRKGTKNDVIRVLRLTASIKAMLQRRRPSTLELDDLVFKSPTGRVIDGDTFRRKYWKKACLAAGVPYRPPYTTRHTLISYGIEIEGWSLPQAAQVAGDAVSTIVANYAHAINPPSMPDFDH